MQVRSRRSEEKKNRGSLLSWRHVKSVFYGGKRSSCLGAVRRSSEPRPDHRFFKVKVIGDSKKNLFSGMVEAPT